MRNPSELDRERRRCRWRGPAAARRARSAASPGLGWSRQATIAAAASRSDVMPRNKRSTSCHGFVPHRRLWPPLGETRVSSGWRPTSVQMRLRAEAALSKVRRRGSAAALAVEPSGACSRRTRSTSSATASGIVALRRSRLRPTGDVAPTAALFLAGKFLPALIAPFLTARLDQVAVRRTLPRLYIVEALVFVALALDRRRGLRVGGRARPRARRRRDRRNGSRRSLAAQSRAPPARPSAPGGQRAAEHRASRSPPSAGRRLRGLLISRVGLSAALAGRRRLVRGHRRGARAARASFRRPQASAQPIARAPPRRPRLRPAPSARAAPPRREAVALILFTLIIPIEVIYAKESLETTSAGFGILLAVVGRRHRRSEASSSSGSDRSAAQH